MLQVSTGLVCNRMTARRGMSVAIVDDAGDYGAVIVSAANLRIDADQIEIAGNTSLLCLQNEVPEAVNISVARKARAVGARVILNAAPARDVADVLMEQTDILVVNRGEAQELGGDGSPAEQAAGLLARGCGAVIVTLGADGLIWADHSTPPTALSARLVDVISTHGAGDAFVGALAAELDRGTGMELAMRFAQAAAALHVATPVDERRSITHELAQVFAQLPSP